MVPRRKTLSIDSVLLDLENARHSKLRDQREVLEWMLSGNQRRKNIKLAESIAERGFVRLGPLFAVPAERDSDAPYVVVEGNRRLAMLKLLRDPSKSPDRPSARTFEALRQKLRVPLPETLEFDVFPSVEEAAEFIQLRHLGEQDGQGVVPWGAKESEDFARRTGHRGNYPYATQLIGYVRDHGILSDEQVSQTPISTLQRVLATQDVRRQMGLSLRGGELTRIAPEPYVHRAIEDVFEALASDDWSVTNLKSVEQRRQFIRKVKEEKEWGTYEVQEEIPLRSEKAPTPERGKEPPSTVPVRRLQRDPLARKTPVASDVFAAFNNKRLRIMFRELKRIDCDDFGNAAWVLTRVFVEGLVTEYMRSKELGQQRALAEKVKAVRQHLLNSHPQKEGEVKDDLKGLEVFSQDVNSIGSANTLNALVHNMRYMGSARDLKIFWDNLSPALRWFEGHV